MKEKLNNLFRYPLILLFFLFIFGYFVLDIAVPDRLRDEYQNSDLAQKPKFQLSSLLKNKYTADYEKYIKEQFAFRHEWMVLKSFLEQIQGKTENNQVVFGDDGYQFYKFFSISDEKQLGRNTNSLIKFCQRHPDSTQIMLVPSADIILHSKLPADAPFVDEHHYLDQMLQDFSEILPSDAIFDLRRIFEEHTSEDLFYRTDHHWSTHGAYLAYTEFAKRNSKTPVLESDLKAETLSPFYGTNYNKSLSPFTQPDTLVYYPQLDSAMTFFEPEPESNQYRPGETVGLYDADSFDLLNKYAMFLHSNHAFSRIKGRNNGKVLVIKDSYANCFVPFLTENYAQIDVIDLRFFSGNIDELIAEQNYETVLILYNFQSFSSDKFIYQLNQ